MIQLLSCLNEAHRDYFGRERLTLFFRIVGILALERDDGCHQVDFESGWSRCGRHTVGCAKERFDADSIDF